MRPRDLTDKDLVRGMVRWSEEDAPSSFDDSFLLSVKGSFDKYGRITPKQREALENIAVTFDVDVLEYR